MDMWNWLVDCYDEGTLDIEDLEEVLTNDAIAMSLWEDFVFDSGDFVEHVRDEVEPFLKYIKKKEINDSEAMP